MRKPERGRFLREHGHTTCSHAGLRREAETERKFCGKLMSCRAEADGTLDGGQAEVNEDDTAWLCCSDGISFAPVNRALWNLVTAKTRRDVLSVCVCVCVCVCARSHFASKAARREHQTNFEG